MKRLFLFCSIFRVIWRRRVNKGRWLFLCTSPLQTKLCEAICRIEGVTDYDLLFVTYQDSEKHRRYYADFATSARHSKYVYLYPGIRYMEFQIAPPWLLRANYGVVACAVVSLWYFRFAAFLHKSADYRTFDDGSGNLIDGGELLLSLEGPTDRAFCSLWGQDLSGLLATVGTHYTIDADYPNIAPNAKKIEINPFPEVSGDDGLGVILGHVSESLPAYDLSLADRWIYLPHPRQEDMDIDGVEIVHTDLIAEDFVIENRCSVVVGTASTALLTLSGVRRVYVSTMEEDPFLPLAEKAGCEINFAH